MDPKLVVVLKKDSIFSLLFFILIPFFSSSSSSFCTANCSFIYIKYEEIHTPSIVHRSTVRMSVFRKRKHIVDPSFYLFSSPNSFLFHFRQIHNIAVQILQEMKRFLHFIWVFRLNQFFQQNVTRNNQICPSICQSYTNLRKLKQFCFGLISIGFQNQPLSH